MKSADAGVKVNDKENGKKKDRRDNLKKSERKTRSDKKNRVGPSLDDVSHGMLERLALACRSGTPSVTKTGLAAEILYIAVRDPAIIRGLQDKYNVREEFRVRPLLDMGERKYNP